MTPVDCLNITTPAVTTYPASTTPIARTPVVTGTTSEFVTTTAGTGPTTTTEATTTTTPYEHVLPISAIKRFCNGSVNLVFLLQSADVLTPTEFKQTKELILTYISSIAPPDYGKSTSKLRVEVDQFGDYVEEDFPLEKHQNMSLITNVVHELELQRSRNNPLGDAIRKAALSFKDKPAHKDIDNIMFVIIFTEPEDNITGILNDLSQKNIQVILLTISSEPNLNNVATYQSVDTTHVYRLSSVGDLFIRPTVAQSILNDLCTGITVPRPPVTTTKQPPTTTPERPPPPTDSPTAEECTMTADLVILVDVQLLKPTEKAKTLATLSDLLHNITVSRDRTQVAMLLMDYRLWRVFKFDSDLQNILRNLGSNVDKALTKASRSRRSALDLRYALEDSLDEYFLSSNLRGRPVDTKVHKSILVFQGRQPVHDSKYPLSSTVRALRENGVVWTIVTPTNVYSNLKERRVWNNLMGVKNMIYSSDFASPETNEKLLEKVCRAPESLPISSTYCARPIDLYFLWDDSEAITGKNLNNMLDATHKIAKTLGPMNFVPDVDGIDRVRVGILQYGVELEYQIQPAESRKLRKFLILTETIQPSLGDGTQPNLQNAIQEILDQTESLPSPRNMSVVLFMKSKPKAVTQTLLDRLHEKGENIMVFSFGSNLTVSDLSSIAGPGGFVRKLARSRELLENNLGNYIGKHLCEPGTAPTTTVAPTTPSPTTTEVSTTPFTGSTVAETTTAAPSCLNPMDLYIVVDSLLTSDKQLKNFVDDTLYNTLADIAIDDGTQYSRVALAVSGPKVRRRIHFTGDGSDKTRLLRRFERDSPEPALAEPRRLNPFRLGRALRSGKVMVFDRNARDMEYMRTMLLVLKRLPLIEKRLSTTDGGLLGLIKRSKKQGYGFVLGYFDSTFAGVSEVRRREWMKEFEGSSLRLSTTDNPATAGAELADLLCYRPYVSTAAVTTTTLPSSKCGFV